MVQVRKLVLAIAAASALSSGMAHALGLGELSVKSTLNQPLVAEIELTEAQGLNASQVVPSLATTADFAQAGVTRQAFLSDLTFTPVINASGKSVLRITSSRPVREPFVKFLVQVLWPNGRLLREYSLLLDPPKYSPEAAAAAAASAPAATPQTQLPSTAPTAEQPAAPAPTPETQAPSAPAPAAEANAKPALYTTSNNDTLWEIAEKNRNGGTVQQTMLAIQALNPDAFIGGNINRLKKGQVLRLPTPSQSTTMPQPQAITEVAAQNQAWRQGRRTSTGARQVDATRRDRAGAAPSRVEAGDNLSLVSAGSNAAGKGSATEKELSNKLAVAQENLDTARRDNAELKSRMNDLQSQLDKMQRLIQLKSDQLAKMQAAGGVVPPATPAATPADSAMPAAVVAPPGSPEAAAKPPGEIAPEDALPAGAAQVTAPGADQPLAVEPVVEPESDADNAFKQLLSNPVVLGIIGGAVVLFLLLLMLFLARRRNAKAEAEKHKRMARALAEESDFVSDMDMELPQASFEGLGVASPNVAMAPPGPAGGSKERPADPLVQAEIHIAYGRMNQAVELLEEAVKEDPARDDIRLKLMEIYAEQGNTKAFAVHERKVVARGKHQAEVEQLKSRYPTMVTAAVVAAAATATAAAVAAELDAKYVEELLLDEDGPQPPVLEVQPEPVFEPEPQPELEPEPVAVAPAEEAVVPPVDDFEHDFDLSLDDLEQASPEHVVDLSAPADVADFELDAPTVAAEEEPSFESLLKQQTEAPVASASDDLADFDLDLAEDEPALTTEDDFLLSLDSEPLDLGEATPVVEPEPEHDLDLPDDFDLSLSDEIESDPAAQAFASEIDDVNAELERLSQNLEHPPMAEPFESPSFTADDMAAMDDEPEFDFLAGTDEAATKLDLARAYIEMGDSDGARDILDEVVSEGDDGQKTEARDMLSRLA
ncbi:peptidoglycan-binding protein [Pseudomonas sp. S25]|uniref:Peptidoglycan-binding protein n=1 Tax=Pseudomonas maioricensis TaxID=1766623 RepID=A0ABS9ZLY4_9PSED|nr:FimV/HubP family polar landmark protein [Pseudomonas sp. S25]MCI8211588.1 peptidoglycan-binding protein [Pseudomonas sp. S25]